MRNPERIKPFLEQIEVIWNRYPDMRFGQLISNIFSISGNPSFFYREDNEFMDIMEGVIQDDNF